MKKFAVIAALFLCPMAAGVAKADGGECGEPEGGWAPREAVESKAKENHWTISQIKTDDGCWVIKGTDDTGRGISVDLEPETLVIVNMDYIDPPAPKPAATPAAPKAPPAKK